MRIRVKLLLLITATLATGFAYAVDSFDYHCANIALLQGGGNGRGKNLQKEIGLTPDRLKRTNKFAAENRAQIEAYNKQLAGNTPDPTHLNTHIAKLHYNAT